MINKTHIRGETPPVYNSQTNARLFDDLSRAAPPLFILGLVMAGALGQEIQLFILAGLMFIIDWVEVE